MGALKKQQQYYTNNYLNRPVQTSRFSQSGQMTLPVFFGCAFTAFGPPLALFVFTIAKEPVRVIILIAAAFFWLVSLLISSLIWFAVVPLRDTLAFGVICSVFLQELFRYFIYIILRRAEERLREMPNFNTHISDNKHTMAYVAGLGYGIISGVFSLVNLLADTAGPGTIGLKGGSNIFFIISAVQALSIILLHTFWSVIFFNALDTSRRLHIVYVVATHLAVSLITFLNISELYTASLITNYIITVVTGALAFKVVGGTKASFKRFITCSY